MRRIHVDSSALKSIGYDAESQTLELEFHDDGGVWQYFNITPSVIKEFTHAASLGNYFVTHIKGKYPEKRVG